MKTFKEYTDALKKEVQLIPSNKLLFWGTWLSQAIYSTNEKHIRQYALEEGLMDIDIIFQELWKIVDNELAFKDESSIQLEIEKIKNFEESNLDRTDEIEVAIYELIISLDLIFNYMKNGERGWEYNIAQAPINIIDVQLQELGLDIITEDDFKNSLIQKEIECQFKMINLLKTDIKVNSDMRRTFRD
jgi:hypothetical protein